jgi:hypothetical protein
MMITADPRDTLALSAQRAGDLHARAAAERLREPSRLRRALALSLRRTADRLDPAPRTWLPTQSLPGGGR